MILLYLDPGTGSMIFQMLIAAALGILFYLKIAKNAVKSFFASIFSRNKEPKDLEN